MLRPLELVDDFVTRAAQAAKLWLVWLVLYAIAFGSAVWSWRRPTLLAKLAQNRISWAERSEAGRWIALAFAALLATYVLVALVQLWRGRGWSLASVAGRLNRWLAFSLALPFVAWLRQEGLEKREPLWVAVGCAAGAACVAVSVYAWRSGDDDDRAARVRRFAGRWLAPLAALALAVGYGWFFSRLAITNHRGLNTRTIDLGYYDNIFYQSSHGRPLGCTFIKGDSHLSAHFDPLLVLLSPIYLLRPGAELLLLLQAAWLATGVIPLFLLARRVLDAGGALVLAAAYALYPALHGANMYEFHSLTMVTPLALWLLYFLETSAFKRYALVLVLCWLVREDVPLLTCTVGVYALLARRPGFARVGWLTIAGSLAYFVVVKRWVMISEDVLNTGKGSYGFAYYFSDLLPDRRGLLELGLSLATNPIYALRHAFANEKKILFLLQIFLPLAALPLFARRARVMLAHGAFLCLAATREAVFTIHFQYACLLFPAAFAMTPGVLRDLRDGGGPWHGLDRKRLVRAVLGFILVVSLLLSWKFGGIVENTAFKGGFSRITRKLDDRQRRRWEALQQMMAQVEPGASVAVTNTVGPHASARARVYFYQSKKPTDYVLILERELKGWVKEWHEQRLDAGALEELGSEQGVQLFRVLPEIDIPPGEVRGGGDGEKKKRKKPAPRPEKTEEPDEDPRVPSFDDEDEAPPG